MQLYILEIVVQYGVNVQRSIQEMYCIKSDGRRVEMEFLPLIRTNVPGVGLLVDVSWLTVYREKASRDLPERARRKVQRPADHIRYCVVLFRLVLNTRL